MPYKYNPVTGKLDLVDSGSTASSATNLAYTATPSIGIVTSDTGNDATIPLATTTNSGLFSPSEKSKLAIALVEEGINYRGDYDNGALYGYDQVVSIPVGSPYGLPGQLFIRVSNPNNPGYPPGTSSWELYDIYTGSPAFDYWVRSVLGTKVTVEVGKGLSTEDYTTAEQTKLSGIAAGAEVNVNADWNATSGDAQILNKPTIPAAQVNSDWNATSGLAEILNKPTSLPTSTVKHTVKYGVALTKGQAVYVSSADGTNMIVSKADYSSEGTSSKTMGLVTISGAANDIGEVITEGLIVGTGSNPLSTIVANAGDPVWLGDDGDLLFGLANKPVAPNHMVFIGIVTRAHAVNGEIFVKVQNGYELDELHNVLITNPANDEVIAFDLATGLWKNKTFTAASSQTLAQTLALGNSVGSNDIDMNNRSITNINNVSTSTTTVQAQAILNQTLIFYSNNC